MQHVSRRWLSIFAYALLGVDFLIIAAYLLVRVYSVVPIDPNTWGLDPAVLVLAITHALYVLAGFPFALRRSPWIATIASQAIFILLLAVMIEFSGYSNFVIRAAYALFIFFGAMSGVLFPLTAVIVTWLVLLYTYIASLITVGDEFSFGTEIIIDLLVTGLAFLGWLYFKKYYEKLPDKETVTLSKLLAQEQFKSNVMLESINDGVMVVDPKGIVQVLNQSAAEMLGWKKEEAIKLDYKSLLKPIAADPQQSTNDTTETVITNTLQKKEATQKVNLYELPSGKKTYIDIVASPIIEPSSTGDAKKIAGVIAVLRNVDQQKKQEQRQIDFISTASHEMRTPVAAIEGYLALALNPQVSAIDEKARSYIQKAHSSTQHLGQLFQDLLTSAKAEDGRLVNHPLVIEMGHFMEQLVDSLRFTAEKKGLILDFMVGVGGAEANAVTGGKMIKPLYYTHADPDRLREVITNLFDNAVKYTDAGKISVGLTGNNDIVQLFVKDTGPGIPPADLGHLFQKFYRVDNTATRTIGGTGLGLFISRKIIEMYNGRIWAESELGKGSTFYINLPRLSSQKAEEMMQNEAVHAQNVSPLDTSKNVVQ